MKEEEKILKAVTCLIEQTQDGKLKWNACQPPNDITEGKEGTVHIVYQTERDNKLIRLYEYKDRVYTDEDVWHWDDRVALELSNEPKNAWWRFPRHSVIWDLLEAVKFKVAGADEFIDNLLLGKDMPF